MQQGGDTARTKWREGDLSLVGEHRALPSYVISALEARRLVSQGCSAFLAHIVDTTVRVPRIQDVPVLRDYADVFPEARVVAEAGV